MDEIDQAVGHLLYSSPPGPLAFTCPVLSSVVKALLGYNLLSLTVGVILVNSSIWVASTFASVQAIGRGIDSQNMEPFTPDSEAPLWISRISCLVQFWTSDARSSLPQVSLMQEDRHYYWSKHASSLEALFSGASVVIAHSEQSWYVLFPAEVSPTHLVHYYFCGDKGEEWVAPFGGEIVALNNILAFRAG